LIDIQGKYFDQSTMETSPLLASNLHAEVVVGHLGNDPLVSQELHIQSVNVFEILASNQSKKDKPRVKTHAKHFQSCDRTNGKYPVQHLPGSEYIEGFLKFKNISYLNAAS
jgi:hypothetical protein